MYINNIIHGYESIVDRGAMNDGTRAHTQVLKPLRERK